MQKHIDRFYKGEKLTVGRMQQLADAANDLLGLQGDGFIELKGNRLTLNIAALLARLPKTPKLYEATADESSGTITVKALASNGDLIGDAITLNTLP